MNFEDALKAIKSGKRVTRATWEHRAVLIRLFIFEEPYAANPPDVVIEYAQKDGLVVPWRPDRGDLLAEDWEFVS